MIKTLRHLAAAAGYSWHGLVDTYRSELAFRLEVILAPVLIALALWLDVSPAERAVLIGMPLLVLVVELLNTAIEAMTDLTMPDKHPLAKKAKDAGSAAVLLAIIATALAWLSILLPKWLT